MATAPEMAPAAASAATVLRVKKRLSEGRALPEGAWEEEKGWVRALLLREEEEEEEEESAEARAAEGRLQLQRLREGSIWG